MDLKADEIPLQTKYALGDDILHSFDLVDGDGYEWKAPF